MANVLQFPRPKVKGTIQLSDKPRYFCKTCDGERFIIFHDGSVSCVCGRHIVNLYVADSRLPA